MAKPSKDKDKEREPGSNKKPKLSNQPLSKDPPPKKGSFLTKLVGLIFGAVLVFAVWTMRSHSQVVGRAPWQWDRQDFQDWLSMSRQVAQDGANRISDEIQKVDWETVKGKITEKTQALWSKLGDLEKNIEERLAKVEAKQAEKNPDAPTPTPKAGEAPPKPDATPAPERPKSNYQHGLESMRDAVRKYRNTPPGSNSGLDASERAFFRAQDYFTKAIDEVPGDQKSEIESLIQECQQYIYDCKKRKTL